MRILIILILPLLIGGSLLVGGFIFLPNLRTTPLPIQQETVSTDNSTSNNGEKSLQLKSFVLPPPPDTPANNQTPPPPTNTLPPPPASTALACANKKVAVNLLLDTSGSMNYPCINTTNRCLPPGPNSKITRLKSTVKNFLSKLQPGDLVAVQTFNSAWTSFVPLQPYRGNEFAINAQIDNALLHGGGYTWIKDALTESWNLIQPLKSSRPDYNWALIFVTDGYPEESGGYFQAQDPTFPSDITRSWKDSPNNLRIISVGFDLDNLGGNKSRALNVVNTVASDPKIENKFEATTANLDSIYNSIASSICR
jgi:hypothetical protein